MRISKASPSTEVYNITIEGSETSFDNHSIESGQSSQIIAPEQGLSFNQELKAKNGSDSSSEVPDDVKGNKQWSREILQLHLDLVSNANIPNVDDNKNEMFNEKFDSDLDEG